MTYQVFARKWRPQDFDEIVGQEHITTTLKNAISMNRLHHAYLFAGPRGIGKTSTARIFSKALNCEKGPLPKPCNTCISCQEITAGSSMDVIEIDGASNRGIDEIRNLRETVKFSPTKGHFKIYIIDEVHMLTIDAFNALLKTLEEPPLHVKFIFATTEPHKVPLTILSRCQRFDFRRIPVKDIVVKLREVAKTEKLEVDEDVFLYIAKSSDGSMRDAESVLDQVASFSKGSIHLKDIISSLGMIGDDVLFECTDIIIRRDAGAAVQFIDNLVNAGKDVKQFLLELLEHFRNMMIVKVGVTSDDVVNTSRETIERIQKQSSSFSQGDIFYAIQIISSSFNMLRQLLPERIVLELCLIKLASRDSIASIEEMLSKLPETAKSQPAPVKIDIPLTKAEPVKKEEIKVQAYQGAQHVLLEIQRVKDAWPILVKAMAVKKMSVSSYLGEGEPDAVKGNTILVAFPRESNFHREVLEEKHNKEAVEAALSQILDQPVKLQFIASDIKIKDDKTSNNTAGGEDIKKKEPIIDNALNILGGKIVKNIRN